MALMGIAIWLVPVELATVTQSVPKPVLAEFVCACNPQPVWSAGQLTVRLPLPASKLNDKFGALVTTVLFHRQDQGEFDLKPLQTFPKQTRVASSPNQATPDDEIQFLPKRLSSMLDNLIKLSK
jgi:hypothetical protein